MRTTMAILALWWAGCTNGSTDDTDTDTETDTTVTEATGDTGTDTPTDTPTDTGGTDDRLDLTFDIMGAWTDTAISISQIDLESGIILNTLASETVTSALHTVATPTPDPADLGTLSDTDPSVLGAIYIAAVHDDDGDGLHQPGESYLGVANPLLLFIQSDNPLPSDLTALGLKVGWNALVVSKKLFKNVPIDDIPLPLPGPSDVTLSGTHVGTDALRMVVFPIIAFSQKGWPTPLYDDVLTAKWQIDIAGEPPVDHQLSGVPKFPEGAAVEAVFAYVDVDDGGAFDADDTLVYPMCTAKGEGVALTWLPQSDDLQTTWFLGGAWGWFATLSESDDFLTLPSPLEDLVIGPCE